MIYIVGDLVKVNLPVNGQTGRIGIVCGRGVDAETREEKAFVTFDPDIEVPWQLMDRNEIVDGPRPKTIYSVDERFLERLS